jgi:hypothetical protein
MKKIVKLLAIAPLALSLILSSCKKTEDDTAPSTSANTEILEGNISADVTLDASKKYTLKGKVYVQAPYKLTIPAGTIIVGDKATQGTLIINRGAKIDALGTAAKPVIMTSSAPAGFRNTGDWGGLIICGNATTNKGDNITIEGISSATAENGLYGKGSGAANETQSSGTIQYVRIEFAGIPLSDDNELNSFTLGGVGSGTTIDHVQVSYANDDAIELFGGSVNAKYLVTYATNDDDFDTDNGYAGKMQYGLIVRDNNIADKSTSRAFEASSNATPATTPVSAPKFANFTILGPWTYVSDASATNISANYGAAVEINQGSNIELHNSIVIGFPIGARFNSAGANSLVTNSFVISNVTETTNAGTAGGTYSNNINTASIQDLFGTSSYNKGTTASQNKSNAASPLYFKGPVPVLASGSAAATGAPNLAAAGFSTEVYYGAFGTAAKAEWNWTSGWLNFDPKNATY